MKKFLYILGLVVIFSSCKKEELILPQDPAGNAGIVNKAETNASSVGEREKEEASKGIFDDRRRFNRRLKSVNIGRDNDDDKNGGGTVNVGGDNDDDKNGGGTGTVNVGRDNDDDTNAGGTSISGGVVPSTGNTSGGDNGDGSGDANDGSVSR